MTTDSSSSSFQTPEKWVSQQGVVRTAEIFFHAGNRLLILLEKIFLVFGLFFLIFLVLYPVLHRIEEFSRLLELLSTTTPNSLWNTFLLRSEWAIELSRWVFLWVSMLGGALGIALNKHIIIDVVTKFLKPRPKAIFSLISGLVALGVCLWLFGFSCKYLYKDIEDGIKTTTMQIPVWWVKSIFPFGFLLFAYHYWINVLKDLRALLTGQFESSEESEGSSPESKTESTS